MRCALSYDENKALIDQKVAAWSEMQSLKENPAYKEEEIRDKRDQEYLLGYKMAIDDVCDNLKLLVDEGEITEEASERLQRFMAANIAMQLFSILDNQEDDE